MLTLPPRADLEDYLISTARDGVQTLITSLFSLPTTSTPDGPLAQLPPPTTQLPRTKPLPKPKPLTKWQQFANAKGIQHRERDKKVWDEEKQDWVNRWGWKGANKKEEEQWLSEVPANAGACPFFPTPSVRRAHVLTPDVDFDPAKKARDERKARVAKNERQHQQNLSRAQGGSSSAAAPPPQAQRKKEIDRTLATTRASTASMGRFDKKLEGEKKLKGVKRKVRVPSLYLSRLIINRFETVRPNGSRRLG